MAKPRNALQHALRPVHLLSLLVATLCGVALFARFAQARPAGGFDALGGPRRAGAHGFERVLRGHRAARLHREDQTLRAALRGAQRVPSAAPASAAPEPSAAPTPTAAAPRATAVAPSVASAAPASIPAPEPSALPSPLEYARLPAEGGDDDDELTEEQRTALGDGLVPVHRSGPFRSPFAHPRFGRAARAAVGLLLVTVRDFNIQEGSFFADFYLSLTGDRALPAIDLAFPNGHELNAVTLADTPTFKLYRVHGTFTTEVDLLGYPFDQQRLGIELEDLRAGVDQLVFEPDADRTALDEGFFVTGWNVYSIGARAYRHRYPPRFDHDDLYVSRYSCILRVDRFGLSAAFSVFVPAIVIVLISLTGLWIPRTELEVRSNTGAPMLAAAVLFHFSLMQTLPATGYLTRADKLMLGVYVALLLNMLSTWAFFVVREDRSEWLFRTAKRIVPPVTLAVLVGAIVL